MNLYNINGKVWTRYSHDPCHCCGMSYTEPKGKLRQLNAEKGIKVVFGTHGEAGDYTNNTGYEKHIKHVKTKNGDLTVITEHLAKVEKSKKWVKV